jgi:GNAT superfamily N-acetyltransferase
MSAIRLASDLDVGAIAGLCRELGYPVEAAEIAARLARLPADEQAVLVHEGAGEGVVGLVHVVERRGLLQEPEAELAALVVAEARRGTGVGSALVAAAEAWARARGLGAVRVRSRVEREAAHGFYARRGYALVKTQRVLRREL